MNLAPCRWCPAHPWAQQHHAAAHRNFYNEYQFAVASAVASLLAPLAPRNPDSQTSSSGARQRPTLLHKRTPIHEHSCRTLQKSFGNFQALKDVSLDFPTGELVSRQPSGCSKTTLLRIIAGLETADSGRVWLDGDKTRPTPMCAERQVGFVFQHYALFRHMTVFDNVAFGLRPSAQDASGGG